MSGETVVTTGFLMLYILSAKTVNVSFVTEASTPTHLQTTN